MPSVTEAIDNALPPRPSLTIKVNGREIKMVYGLEMDLRRMLPDPSATLNLIQSDPFTQDYIVRRVLTDKKGMVTDLNDLVNMDDVDLDPEQVEEILTWAAEHALYFFVKRTLQLAELGVRYQRALPATSETGSQG